MPKEIPLVRPFLELGELLDGLAGAGQHTENVESDLNGGEMCVSLGFPSACASLVVTYSLAQRPALSNGNLVTLLNTEGWGDVGGEVLVSLLVTGVLGDEVEVLAADDDGTVHLGGHNSAGQDTSTDGDETGEGALLVCGRQSWSAFESLRSLPLFSLLVQPSSSDPHKQQSPENFVDHARV